MANVGQGGDTEVEAAALGVYQFNGADVGEVGEHFHDEGVVFPLWAYPVGRFQANVAIDGVKECPGVGEVARIDIEALLVAGVAEDGPGDTCLKL